MWGPGDYPSTGGAPGGTDYLTISGVSGQQGLTREYKVHIPASYKVGVPTPVVFCLHGYIQNPQAFCDIGSNTTPFTGDGTSGGFITQSNTNGFILIMPNGYDGSWNGGTCCGAAQSMNLDDVSLMRAILAEVEQHVTIDTSRVYAAGFSNGGFMADRLACEASDMIAAVFTGSGSIMTTPVSACKPANKVAVLGTHGDGNDVFVSYSGDQASMAQFASANGCSTTTSASTFPASAGTAGAKGSVSCVSYNGCPSGGQVTFCSIIGGGHCWFGSPDCGSGAGALGADISLFGGVNTQNIIDSNVFWPFLSQYRR
jgi:polyhydroxybutyrate depolymerase